MKAIVEKYRNEIQFITREMKGVISANKTEFFENDTLQLLENHFFLSKYIDNIDTADIADVINCIYRRVVNKYGILNELLEDETINEIMVNGPDKIFVEKYGKIKSVDDSFLSAEELENTIRMFAADVHREINEMNPIVDARLESGYRVNGVLKNVALNGPILTIRKFSRNALEMKDLIEVGSITEECSNTLCSLVNAGYNIFISGGTSSGKTTFLNALASSINENERAVIIEDSAELKIDHLKNIVHLECRNANSIGRGEVTMEQLIRTSLRMRPDRIIVGEVRGSEVTDMIQAMNTGHDGSMSTGHGNSISGMLNRLETMFLSGTQIPLYSIKSQIANAIEIFVHLKRDEKGRRRVVEVAETVKFDGSDYLMNYLYLTDQNGKLVNTGNKIVNREKLIRGSRDD